MSTVDAFIAANRFGLGARPGELSRIAAIEAGGWDTHFNQANRLRNLLRDLADGLTAFREALGPA